jgi:hypothetical protein
MSVFAALARAAHDVAFGADGREVAAHGVRVGHARRHGGASEDDGAGACPGVRGDGVLRPGQHAGQAALQFRAGGAHGRGVVRCRDAGGGGRECRALGGGKGAVAQPQVVTVFVGGVDEVGARQSENDVQREGNQQACADLPQQTFHCSLRCIYMSAGCGGPSGAGMLAQTLKMGNRFLGVYAHFYSYLCTPVKC